jgi:hypothetical protein
VWSDIDILKLIYCILITIGDNLGDRKGCGSVRGRRTDEE